MSDCGHQCHMVGGPWIAENPDCPIHGVDGLDPHEARDVIRELCNMLEGYADPEHIKADELIQRARALL